MPKYEVCVLETREYIFEVEARDESEAQDIALEEDTSNSVRDSYSSRSLEWIEKL